MMNFALLASLLRTGYADFFMTNHNGSKLQQSERELSEKKDWKPTVRLPSLFYYCKGGTRKQE